MNSHRIGYALDGPDRLGLLNREVPVLPLGHITEPTGVIEQGDQHMGGAGREKIKPRRLDAWQDRQQRLGPHRVTMHGFPCKAGQCMGSGVDGGVTERAAGRLGGDQEGAVPRRGWDRQGEWRLTILGHEARRR